MAHEIRNPLGGIQLYASLLAKDVADRPDSLQLVTRSPAACKRLEALVGQVLQFTREMQRQPGADGPGRGGRPGGRIRRARRWPIAASRARSTGRGRCR